MGSLLDTFPVTLAAAKEAHEAAVIQAGHRGSVCPCCRRRQFLYKRTINAEMAVFLIKLVKAWRRRPRFYHTSELIRTTTKAATDASYLVHWGLLERGRHGQYRPTPAGLDFVHEQLKISAYVTLLNNEPQDWSSETMGIREALGGRYSLETLMRDD